MGAVGTFRKWELDAFAAVYKVFLVQHGSPQQPLDAMTRRETVLANLQRELNIGHEEKARICSNVGNDSNVKRVRDGLLAAPGGGGGYGAPAMKKQKVSGGFSGSRARGGAMGRGAGGAKKAGSKPTFGVPPAEISPYIGRKVRRYWADEGGWFEAVISDFNKETGEHVILYQLGQPDESWESALLEELPPEEFELLNETIDMNSYLQQHGAAVPPAQAAPAFTPADGVTEVEAQVARVKDTRKLDDMKSNLIAEEQALRQQLEALGSDSDDEDASSEGDTSVSEE